MMPPSSADFVCVLVHRVHPAGRIYISLFPSIAMVWLACGTSFLHSVARLVHEKESHYYMREYIWGPNPRNLSKARKILPCGLTAALSPFNGSPGDVDDPTVGVTVAFQVLGIKTNLAR